MTLTIFLRAHPELVEELAQDMDEIIPAGVPGRRLKEHQGYALVLQKYVLRWVTHMEELARAEAGQPETERNS